MDIDSRNIYPDFPGTARTVSVGGFTKTELLHELQRNSILMNPYAERLFASDFLTMTQTQYRVKTVELAVGNLGFSQAVTIPEIYERAGEVGLGLCPLELGPYLRLHYLEQPEGYLGKPSRENQAPYGSITVASEKFTDDEDFPKGFYLRRINGVLWLRGYRSNIDQLWESDVHFVFVEQS